MIKAAKVVRNVLFSTLLASTTLNVSGAEMQSNPVIAVVNGVELNKSDLETIHKNLQEPWSQYDFESLFPTLQDLAIRLQLAKQDGLEKKLDETEEFKKNIGFTTANILQDLALNSYINEQLTEESLREYYNDKIKDFSPEEERKMRHILVETPEKAVELIKRLDAGEDFNALAVEASIGPSGANGGELGWASKNEFVPEFANAAWSLEKGTYGKAPVQTSFGYHVIFVDDIRKTEEPQFEDVKALLEGELQRDLEERFFEELQEKAKIERFDVKGEVLAIPEAPKEVEPQEESLEAVEAAAEEVVEEIVVEAVEKAENEDIEAVKKQAEELKQLQEEIGVKGKEKAKEITEELIQKTEEEVSNAIEAGDAAISKSE